MAEREPIERITAWRCIGCGRVDAPQPCIGVCRDRRTELVEADDYDRLAAVVRRIATITPRDGEWESSYRALQVEARAALQG